MSDGVAEPMAARPQAPMIYEPVTAGARARAALAAPEAEGAQGSRFAGAVHKVTAQALKDFKEHRDSPRQSGASAPVAYGRPQAYGGAGTPPPYQAYLGDTISGGDLSASMRAPPIITAVTTAAPVVTAVVQDPGGFRAASQDFGGLRTASYDFGGFHAAQSEPVVMSSAPYGVNATLLGTSRPRRETSLPTSPQPLATGFPLSVSQPALNVTYPAGYGAAAFAQQAPSLPPSIYSPTPLQNELFPAMQYQFVKDEHDTPSDSRTGDWPPHGQVGSHLHPPLEDSIWKPAGMPASGVATAHFGKSSQELQEADRLDAMAAAHERRVAELEAAPPTPNNLEHQIQELLEGQEALRYELNHVKMQVRSNFDELEAYRRDEMARRAGPYPPPGPPQPQRELELPPQHGQLEEMLPPQHEQAPPSWSQQPLQSQSWAQPPLPPPSREPDDGRPQPPPNLGYSRNQDDITDALTSLHSHASRHAATLHGHATRHATTLYESAASRVRGSGDGGEDAGGQKCTVQ